MNELISVAEAAHLIESGACLSIAGPESALDQLPSGQWIGGTIPYFMVAEGGKIVTEGSVFVTDLSKLGTVQIAIYDPDHLAAISAEAPENGFALTIIPAGSRAHRLFAEQAPSYPDAFMKLTVGWISGVHLSDLGRVSPKVYDGRTATKVEEGAVVARVSLPADRTAQVEITNLFKPGGGDVLHFDEVGARIAQCRVNGVPTPFAEYLRSKSLADGRLPLVGDFAGAHINVSIQGISDNGEVDLYAPVFPGVDYHVAAPVEDYAQAFRSRLGAIDHEGLAWGCNCVLNFLYGELEGKSIGGIEGPVTFGEIAYQLLNQTLVTLRIGS